MRHLLDPDSPHTGGFALRRGHAWVAGRMQRPPPSHYFVSRCNYGRVSVGVGGGRMDPDRFCTFGAPAYRSGDVPQAHVGALGRSLSCLVLHPSVVTRSVEATKPWWGSLGQWASTVMVLHSLPRSLTERYRADCPSYKACTALTSRGSASGMVLQNVRVNTCTTLMLACEPPPQPRLAMRDSFRFFAWRRPISLFMRETVEPALAMLPSKNNGAAGTSSCSGARLDVRYMPVVNSL